MIVRSDFTEEAINTIKVNGWTLMVALLFGKKIIAYDSGLKSYIELRVWRGTTYMKGRCAAPHEASEVSPTKEKP